MAVPYGLLERQPGPAYLLTGPSLRISWVNTAFERVAAHGGASNLANVVIGRAILDFIPRPLRRFYQALYHRVMMTRTPHRHDYQCSSTDAVSWFRQYVLPEGDSVAVVNARIINRTREPLGALGGWSDYLGTGGLVTQCAHCRRIKNQRHAGWELHRECFEPASNAPQISHGICELCFSYFFERGRVSSDVCSIDVVPELVERLDATPAAVWDELQRA